MDDDVSRFRPDRESGAATVETVGMALVAATLVTGVVVATVPASDAMGDALSTRVCQVVTLGQGGCTTPAPDRSGPRSAEACVAAPGGVERVADVASTAFTTADGRRVAVQRLSTGRHRVAVSAPGGPDDHERIDLGGELLLTVPDGDGVPALEVQDGEVYLTDDDGLPDLVDTLVQDQVKDVVLGDSGPMRRLTDGASEVLGVEGELPDPGDVLAEGEVSLNASVEATGPIPRGDDGPQAQVLATRTGSDGSTTVYLRALLAGDDVPFLDLDDEVPVVSAVSYDPDGYVTHLAATTTTSGDDGVTVHQVSLPTDTDDAREVAGRFLTAQGRPLPSGWTAPGPGDDGPDDPLGGLVLAAQDDGTLTEQTYGSPSRTREAPPGLGLDAADDVAAVRVPVTSARQWQDGWRDWSACE